MMDPNKRGRKLFKGGKSKGYISIRAPDEGKKPYNVHISHFFFQVLFGIGARRCGSTTYA